ncbi:MAG TPA: multiubiquitin domain-containing protein [Puia sp.]|nr:multiubiquitin domain-containing protein [Puia sp.]
MEQQEHRPERPKEEEIKELREELARDQEVQEQAEKIVQETDADMRRIEKKLEELEHPEIELVVNGEPKLWHQREISYKEVVILYYGTYEDDEAITYSVDYSHGPEGHREGILKKGQSVPVINKMRFRVQRTNRS